MVGFRRLKTSEHINNFVIEIATVVDDGRQVMKIPAEKKKCWSDNRGYFCYSSRCRDNASVARVAARGCEINPLIDVTTVAWP